MKGAAELKELIKSLNDRGIGDILLATVKKVDEGTCSCKVTVDGMEIVNVRLKAVKDEKPSLKIFPKEGSDVLIQRITDGDYMVVMMTEQVKVVWEMDGSPPPASLTIDGKSGGNVLLHADGGSTKIELDAKVRVRNQIYGLLELIHEFIDICKDEIHMTNAGPTVSLNPANKALFTVLKEKFSKLLKN